MKTRMLTRFLLCGMLFGAMGTACLFAQAPANPNATKRGAEVLAAAAKAAGGDAVKNLKSVEFTAAGEVSTGNGPLTVEIKAQFSYPDKMRLETTLPNTTIQSGFDGKSGWAATPEQTIDLPSDLNGESLRGIDLAGGLGLYRKVLAGKADAEYAGEREIAGQKALLIEWAGPTGRVKLYFDPASKLLVVAQYRAITLQGAFDEERRWSDYREVDGVKFPFHWVTQRNGSPYSDMTIHEIKTNAALDAARFSRPQ